ncbi:hypothetical protein FRC11_011956, partial [Ceratobasidium sp. 423]
DGYRNEQNGYGNEQNGYANGHRNDQNGGYRNDQTRGYTNDQTNYAPDAQTYPTDQTAYTDSQPQSYIHTPPSFQSSPAMGGVPVLGPAPGMEIINLNKESMLFADGYDMMPGYGDFTAYT